jgi:hypothetical protein
MSDRTSPADRGLDIPPIDTTKAHIARIYDYMLGGTTNFEVDRRAAEATAATAGGMEAVRASTRGNRALLRRVVRYLVTEEGIRQFLDIGSGLPTEQNVHQVAQEAAPESRIVYVDNDPIVLAHSHTLMASTPEGAVKYVVADLRDTGTVLSQAAETLDFGKPTAVLLFTILHHILDREDPWGIVRRLVDAVPSGSYLAISHLTGDFNPQEMAQGKEVLDREMAEPFIMRPKADIERFFEGLEMVEPGLVHIGDWRPDADTPQPVGGFKAPIWGGVARIP